LIILILANRALPDQPLNIWLGLYCRWCRW